MSNCLNDARLQAVAADEGTPLEQEHVRTYEACRARVADARAAVAEFGRMMSSIEPSQALGARTAAAVARAGSRRAGATTLRAAPRTRRAHRAWVFAAAGGVAAAAIIFFVLLPSVDSVTTLSAAEILDRSLQTLTPQGTELLEYDLSLKLPGESRLGDGTFRIEQVIDHDGGRWRFARFAADGTMLNGISEDPTAGIRAVMVRVDGRTYRFRFDVAAGQPVPVGAMQRRSADAMIRLVQASAHRAEAAPLTKTPDEKRFVIEFDGPRLTNVPAMGDLTRARLVIEAADSHIVEAALAGVSLGEAVALDCRLIRREVRPTSQVPPADFERPRDDPAAIELHGRGTAHPPDDRLVMLLREIAQRR